MLGCSVSLVVAEQPALSALKAWRGGPLESVYARLLWFNTFHIDTQLRTNTLSAMLVRSVPRRAAIQFTALGPAEKQEEADLY